MLHNHGVETAWSVVNDPIRCHDGLSLPVHAHTSTRFSRSQADDAYISQPHSRTVPVILDYNMEGNHMSANFIPSRFTTDVFEYERQGTNISVVGRLRHNILYWKQIGCAPYILDVLAHGYVIPLQNRVEPSFLNNNKSSREEPAFVQKAIDELLESGAIIECSEPVFVTNPLTVAKKGGKKRLVIDLRHLNGSIKCERYKYEGLDTIAQYLELGGYLTAFDLKAGYHHIDVHREQHDLLGFCYPDHQGNARYFKFIVLPFGLSTAGLIFSKVLRELLKFWRAQKIQAACFLDDGLQTNSSKHIAYQHALLIKGSLISAGWVPHREKSIWVPVQVATWLGVVVDLLRGKILCSENRLKNAEDVITFLLEKETVHIKLMAKIRGMIASMERSHGDIVHMMCRFMNLTIAEAPSWSCKVRVTAPVKKELAFWKSHLRSTNGKSLFQSPASGSVTYTTYSDASDMACATVLTPCPERKKLVVNRMFDPEEMKTSSTERELLAVLHGLTQFREILKGSSLNWYTDAQNVARIVRRGSPKPYLANLAVAIYHITSQQDINLNMIWVPRDQNEEADFWSRVRDFDDWGISSVWFHKICQYFNFTATIDRFADNTNKKLPRFNARFYHVNAEAVDSFTQNWGTEKNWVVPPIYLINRALDYAKLCKAEMVLVFPLWRSAAFWPSIQSMIDSNSNHILNKVEMGNIFTKGTTENSVFNPQNWRGKTMALHLKY